MLAVIEGFVMLGIVPRGLLECRLMRICKGLVVKAKTEKDSKFPLS